MAQPRSSLFVNDIDTLSTLRSDKGTHVSTVMARPESSTERSPDSPRGFAQNRWDRIPDLFERDAELSRYEGQSERAHRALLVTLVRVSISGKRRLTNPEARVGRLNPLGLISRILGVMMRSITALPVAEYKKLMASRHS